MKVEDLRPKGAGWVLRLHEKGGKHHVMPCHHSLAEALRAYTAAAGIEDDRKGFLFRTSRGHRGVELSGQPMTQPDAWRMIRKRAAAVGIFAPIGNHSFRATGITAYLANGGALEHAQVAASYRNKEEVRGADAEHSVWYRLATVYGEATSEKPDWQATNRRTWNRLMCNCLI
jgi:integrase